jgi:hypothetical protein
VRPGLIVIIDLHREDACSKLGAEAEGIGKMPASADKGSSP